jgi:hypothetical protein
LHASASTLNIKILYNDDLFKIITALLVLLFAYAAISKLMDYHKFSHYLGRSPVLSPFATQIAWIIPAIELLTVGLLLYKKTRLKGMYGSLFLMVLFTGYLFIILNFSNKVPCSCGGILQGLTWKTHIVFNICFLILALVGSRLQIIQQRSGDEENHYDNLQFSPQ